MPRRTNNKSKQARPSDSKDQNLTLNLGLGIGFSPDRPLSKKVVEQVTKKITEELGDIQMIMENSEDEYDLINNPIYQAMKEDLNVIETITKNGIASTLVTHEYFHEAVFWLDVAVHEIPSNEPLYRELLDMIVTSCTELCEFKDCLRYGKMLDDVLYNELQNLKPTNFAYFGITLPNPILPENTYLRIGNAAMKIGQYKDAFNYFVKRMNYIMDVEKKKEEDAKDHVLPFELMYDVSNAAVKANLPKKAKGLFEKFFLANLNQECPCEMDAPYYYTLLEQYKESKRSNRNLESEVGKTGVSLIKAAPEMLLRIGQICHVKSDLMRLLYEEHDQVEWLVKADEIHTQILRSMDVYDTKYREEIFVRKICICLEMDEIDMEAAKRRDRFFYQNLLQLDKGYDSLQKILKLVKDYFQRKDIYFLHQCDQKFDKREKIWKFLNTIWKKMSEGDKLRYLHYKNSITINEHFESVMRKMAKH